MKHQLLIRHRAFKHQWSVFSGPGHRYVIGSCFSFIGTQEPIAELLAIPFFMAFSQPSEIPLGSQLVTN